MSDFYLDTFLGMDLKWGVFIYGAVCSILSSVLAFDFNMKWHFYLYWSMGITPYSAAVVSLIVNMYAQNDGGNKAFQRGQWYFCVLTFALAILFTVVQTIYLSIGLTKLWPNVIAAAQAQAGMISGMVAEAGSIASSLPIVPATLDLVPSGGSTSSFSDPAGYSNDFATPTTDDFAPNPAL